MTERGYNVLGTDAGGRPVGWLTTRQAATHVVAGDVLWAVGDAYHVMRGGVNAETGLRTEIELQPVLALRGADASFYFDVGPACTREAILQRDRNTCMYCATTLSPRQMTMDHVTPKSRGGPWAFENIVACCPACNARKGANEPHEVGMSLLAVPYAPTHAEALILEARRGHLIADQMEFLVNYVPRARRALYA